MSIRTTVTLDEDVVERVKAESLSRGATFRDTLNDLLRLALVARKAGPKRKRFKVRPHPMGLHPGLSYDDIEGLISFAEGEDHR